MTQTTTFDFMAEFISQIEDDTIREQLEEALERMIPEQETELAESGSVMGEDASCHDHK